MSDVCAEQLKIDRTKFDLQPASLIYIWEWFLKKAKIEKTPKARIREIKKKLKASHSDSFAEDFAKDDTEQFSLETEYILRDIGMYLGEVFVSNHSNIYWSFYTKPKRDYSVNTPLLLGFEDSEFNPPFKMEFEPIHMAGVQAANLFDNTHNKRDLYNMYQMWEQHHIPKVLI